MISEIPNTAAQASHGAGTGAAATMSKSGVEAVISGRFGPKASEALQALSIEMWIAPEGVTASRALELLHSGDLERMEIRRY